MSDTRLPNHPLVLLTSEFLHILPLFIQWTIRNWEQADTFMVFHLARTFSQIRVCTQHVLNKRSPHKMNMCLGDGKLKLSFIKLPDPLGWCREGEDPGVKIHQRG